MSTDCVLVSAEPPTLHDLESAGQRATSTRTLAGVQLDGTWADEPVVGVAGYLGGGRPPLLLRIARPRRVRPVDAAEVTADLFLAAPVDDDGMVWLTELTMANPDDAKDAERQFLGLMALVAPIAIARGGYLVLTSGGPPSVVALDAVPAPEPLSLDDDPARPEPVPPAQVFNGVVLALPGAGAPGWRNTLEAVDLLSGGSAALVPDHALADEQWGPLSDDPPQWWPMHQSLFASRGRFSWLVAGSEQTELGHVTSIVGRGPAPDQASPTLGRGLAALTPWPLDYGFVHPWHPDEPWTGPVGPRLTGNGPFFMLAARDLDEGLPQLYWLQILGPRWVQRLGTDRLASTPAYRVQQVGEEHWMLQLAPSLAAVTGDYATFALARDQAIAHLGREHFPFLA